MFLGMILASVVLITLNIQGLVGGLLPAARQALFQVVTIVTSTGYASTDYNLWPAFSKIVILILMFVGACGGSTGGGAKVIRALVMLKAVKIKVEKQLHPRIIKTVKVNGKMLDAEVLDSIFLYFAVYVIFLIGATLLLSVECEDMAANFTAVLSALSNIGPGLGSVGPASNYAFYSPFAKLILSFCMLAGRLEFFPVLVLLAPSVWKNR
jgi:trk system potassium uptake protein TrkH